MRIQTKQMLLAGVLLLTGCAPIEVALGLRIHIDRIPIASASVSLAGGPAIAPGQRLPLVVTFTQPDGAVLKTEGAGDGKVLWQELKVSVTLVSVDAKGRVRLRKDARYSDGKTAHVTVTVPSHPDLQAGLDIPVGYKYNFACDFSGSAGSTGSDGSDGLDGSSGSSGSMDPDNPSPGGNGSDGSDGSAGASGGAGGDAPPVAVMLTLKRQKPPLLQVLVSAGNKSKHFLVDPEGGSLTIKADGGPGGNGGRGGRGGRGGSGGSGSPSGMSGSDGRSGQDGSSGFDGSGGLITVIYDPQAAPYLSNLHLSSKNGPKPAFKQQTVGPLW